VTRPLHSVSFVALAVSMVALGYALNNLRSGLAEIPHH
jgi:hypothetical protein